MKSTKNTAILILTLTFLAAGCSDAPFSPGNGKQPPGGVTTFGLVEVTISGIGTDHMTAQARPARSNTAFSLTEPSGTGGPNDGTIQMEPVSNGSFTFGIRGSGGVRYLYATFKVRNADVDGFSYPTSRQNLTFLAVDTDGTASAPETYGETVISELRLFDGTELSGSPAATIAEAAIPTGLADLNSPGYIVTSYPDVLQVFTEADVSAIPTPAGVTVFPYGFMTRSPGVTPGSREVTSSLPGQFNGVVSFAFKLPLQSQANQDPFEISAMFLPVDDSETRITQALEEQTTAGNAALLARFAELSPTAITLLPGSTYGGASSMQCEPVRVAGPAGSPSATLFPALPGFTSLTPDPYAADGSAGHIPATSAFTASFAGPVVAKEPVGSHFVISGHQSGLPFLNGSFSGNSTTSISSPAGSFFAGEIVEVSLISGFGACAGTVARYRIEATAGTGSFGPKGAFLVGIEPSSVALGDVNGDGALDVAITNFSSDNLSVLLGDGAGGFTEALNSPFAVGNNPNWVSLGDVNGDGALDMAVANGLTDDLSVLLGDGAGGFTQALNSPFAVGNTPTSVALGDVNGDGTLDMAVANGLSDDLSVLLGNGSGSFSPAPGSPFAMGTGLASVALGDVNGDGSLDVAVAKNQTDEVSVLLGDGSGGFSETAGSPFAAGDGPQTVVLGDVNGDGALDIATANITGDNVSVLLSDGAGGFSEAAGSPYTVGLAPSSMALGDVNGDGDLDMIVTNNLDNNLSVLLGDGTGGFAAVSGSPFAVGDRPYSVALGDVNGDGALDVAITNYSTDILGVLLNQ